MLTAKLTDNNRWVLVEGDAAEMRQLKLAFTKKINSWFIIKNKNPNAIVDEKFMNNFGLIPVGLWIDLIYVCKSFGYSISFVDGFEQKIKDCNISHERVERYVSELFANNESMSPRDYQIDALVSVLQYRKCSMEISTSGGKTFIAYMLCKYLMDHGVNHILFVTPKTDLTSQSADKFLEYDNKNQIITDWTWGEVHSKAKKKEKYDENIIFGNYQSLCKKKPEFFEKFGAVIVDECHHATSSSIRNIMKKCANADYKIGMTGTFPKEGSYDAFVLASYIGPVVFRLPSSELIDVKKSATPVYVNTFVLKYLDDNSLEDLYKMRAISKKDDPTIGSKILNYEKDIIRESTTRLRYICDMIMKTTKNTLVIFSDVENGYGRRIYDRVKEGSEKTVFYIDGSIPSNIRGEMKQAMEDDLSGNTVIVASMGCFSEGIDISNMFNIFLVETTKSDTILAQILGRGMRMFEGKDKTIMIDFVDDFRYGDGNYRNNYAYRHGMERMEIYKQRGFKTSYFEIDLRQKSLF